MFQTTLEKTEAKTVEYTMPVGAIWLWEMDFTCKTGKTTTGKTTYTMPIEQAAIAPNEGSVPCCLPGCFQNLRDLTKGCVTTGLCENAPNVCQSDDTTAVTNMGHRDHADKGSRVSAGAVAGGASALVALVAVGAAIRVRHRRAQQASDHASPGTSAADDDAVPAVSGPANAL